MSDTFPFRDFLFAVRMRATSALVKEIQKGEEIALKFGEAGDPADIHEDVRELLWAFFEEIREQVEGPMCGREVHIGTNCYALCDLLTGHDGRCHPCAGEEIVA